MRSSRLTILSISFVAASCTADAPTQPLVDDLMVTAEAKPQSVACRTTDLKAIEKGKIKKNDCLFGAGQRENLFRVDQAALGLPDLSGANMLQFTPDAEFDGIFGASKWDDTTFGDPVYGFRQFSGGTMRSFALIGSAPEYKLFMSGADADQLGKYELTTTVHPSANTCETGVRTFLQGTVTFSSALSDDASCNGTIAVGPYAGGPLKYQYWYAKVTEGQEVEVRVEGVDGNEPTITLAVLVFPSTQGAPFPFAQLDFQAGPGDTDREITFTAPFTAYYYVEVSSAPGVSSPYQLSFTGT